MIFFSLDRIIKNFMLIYLILEENNIYRKSSHFFFYEDKLPALTIKLFDDMKEIRKEKFALHCTVSLKSTLHCIVSNFLHCTISLLLMFLGWKLDSYCFARRDLAFWYLAFFGNTSTRRGKSGIYQSFLYSVLFIAYLLVICL